MPSGVSQVSAVEVALNSLAASASQSDRAGRSLSPMPERVRPSVSEASPGDEPGGRRQLAWESCWAEAASSSARRARATPARPTLRVRASRRQSPQLTGRRLAAAGRVDTRLRGALRPLALAASWLRGGLDQAQLRAHIRSITRGCDTYPDRRPYPAARGITRLPGARRFVDFGTVNSELRVPGSRRHHADAPRGAGRDGAVPPRRLREPERGHAAARTAKTALEEAREEVAELLGARPGEVVFTAGGTEADNLAVKGAARARPCRRHAATASSPPPSSTRACSRPATASRPRVSGSRRVAVAGAGGRRPRRPARRGRRPHRARLGDAREQRGRHRPAPRRDRRAGARARRRGRCSTPTRSRRVPWLDVASAAVERRSGRDLGAQVRRPEGHRRAGRARRRVLEPLIEGGGQEGGRRSGTSNVAGAVGMAAALRVDRTTRATTDGRARRRDCATG